MFTFPCNCSNFVEHQKYKSHCPFTIIIELGVQK